MSELSVAIRTALALTATLWTMAVLYQLYKQFVHHPDEGGPALFGALRVLALLAATITIVI